MENEMGSMVEMAMRINCLSINLKGRSWEAWKVDMRIILRWILRE